MYCFRSKLPTLNIYLALAASFATCTRADQRPLSPGLSITSASNYSFGFTLQSSYAAVAVIIEHPDGSNETVTRVLEGDSTYRQVMARLSLPSSQHLAPPYDGMDQIWADLPRVWARKALKKVGLPATPEVGVLGSAVRKLRNQIESDLGLDLHVSNALLTTTHLIAFYEDDAEDICEYAGIEHIRPQIYMAPPLWETAAAYAGYGQGLCDHFQNETLCNYENRNVLPTNKIMAVHYSRAALTVSYATLQPATWLFEPTVFRRDNFSLGGDTISGYSNQDQYWQDVKSALLDVMVDTPTLPKPSFLILTGDDLATGYFLQYLREVMQGHLGYAPFIYFDDARLAAARGAAELRRRTSYRKKFPWEKWSAVP